MSSAAKSIADQSGCGRPEPLLGESRAVSTWRCNSIGMRRKDAGLLAPRLRIRIRDKVRVLGNMCLARASLSRYRKLYYSNDMTKAYDGETIEGVPVTEQLIDEAVARAEKGYDVEALKRRGRPKLNPNVEGESAIIPVRMDEALLGALTAKAEQDGLTRSEAIREAIRRWAHVA